MTWKLEKGAIIPPGNFVLVERIESLDRFYEVLQNNPSIFARHRMYPSAFFLSWQIKECKSWLDQGYFWKTLKIIK